MLTDRAVAWSSDDVSVATVTANGGTTALATAVGAGTAHITATSEGRSGGQALVVEATPPPPGSGQYPNEPSGYALVTSRAFNLLAEDGWDPLDLVTGGFLIVPDLTALKSPPSVGQIFYPAGQPGGYGTGKTTKRIEAYGFTRLYLSLWVKLSSNWSGHLVVNKVAYVWTHGSPVVVPAYIGEGSSPLHTQVRIQDVPAYGGAQNFEPNLADPAIPRGRWVRWELRLVNNTGDDFNGEIHWWIDGTKCGEYTDVKFSSAAQPKVWEKLEWSPIWGGVGATVPENMYMWMDHWYTSGAP